VSELPQPELLDWQHPLTKLRWHQNSVWGGAVYGGRRTLAHLEWTAAKAERKFGHRVEVMQGAYNDDVEASAGTHDLDAAIDFFIPGLNDWWAMQRFFRECGWASWYRYPPAFPRHVHGISLGYPPAEVGIYVPGQVEDYRNHAFGLAGQHDPGSDNSWFPPDIDKTIFDYRQWAENQEALMPLNADDKAWIKDAIAANNKQLIDTLMIERIELEGQEKLTVRGALRRAAGSAQTTVVRTLAKRLGQDIEDVQDINCEAP
jgi:hypothetical protein